jgi:hypothetical protein
VLPEVAPIEYEPDGNNNSYVLLPYETLPKLLISELFLRSEVLSKAYILFVTPT